MDFRSLPSAPDDPRYAKRLRDIMSLLRNRKERLIEEGMLMDRATAEDDLWWFCLRCTSFESYRVAERGHPMEGELWIYHPFAFWLCRQVQEIYEEPQGGWVWIKIHRYGIKSTVVLASCRWVHSRNASATIGFWTAKQEDLGENFGRGLLAEIEHPRLQAYFPQFRNMSEAKKTGYVVDRPAGPREQSLTISSILTALVSAHPDIFILDDVVSDRLRGNVEQIKRVGDNISALAAMITPDAPVLVCNTPQDEADPLISREKDGLFAKVIYQSATEGGDFTPAGTANLHTLKFYSARRREIKNDPMYYAQFELKFVKGAGTLFDWSWMTEYNETPEQLAELSPYINIIIDGAKGTKGSDFAIVRVITWTGHDRWATLDLIRERVGQSKIFQILLGRDKTDTTSKWVEDVYCKGGIGLVEKWMKIDKSLVLWFDGQGNSGWKANFEEMARVRGIQFPGGKMPLCREWPEIHKGKGETKKWKISQLESHYQRGCAAYPAKGFHHGSVNGLAGGPDDRDTKKQFKEDEFDRMQLSGDLPFDDMLDTESNLVMEKVLKLMRRPKKGGGYSFNGIEYPAVTVNNPWGLPGGGKLVNPGGFEGGRTWLSM
jgi:hypothetical protein